jgi:DNA invertase Pin-like site-specific DNA recombinase
MTAPANPFFTEPWMAAIGQHLTPTQANAISVAGPHGFLTTMPIGDPGLRFLRHNVYIRRTEKEGQFRPDTTHLGYSVSGHLVAVPISRWWLIGSAEAIPSTGVAHLAAIMAEPGLHADWPRFATLLELGGPVTASMPLGYAPPGPKKGGTPAIQGIIHRPLVDVLAAADAGHTFQTLTKLQMRVDDTDRVADQTRSATRYGYARVSTREQNPDSQYDALTAAGLDPGNIVIEKISGKLASRPKLDQLLARLQPGDTVVVTRLRRIGRNHKHLLELVEWFEVHQVDFVVLEQGIDTTTPLGRLFFRFLAALAEFDREMIAEGTREGLASARARGRTGGRPPVLSQVQLDQAQRMYDEDRLTVEEIAKAFRVGRSTLYENLAAYKDGRDCVLVVYRNTRPGKIDDANRRYGETGQSEKVQMEADRKWWPVAPARQPRLKGIVYVVNGTVARIRAVDPEGAWQRDDRGYADIPLTPPLTEIQIAEQLPTLGLRLGDHRPHVKGKIREYLTL